MGDVRAFVLAIGAVLIGLELLLGWVNYKIDKLKEEDKLNIDIIAAIISLEKAVKKLNEALRTESGSLSDTKRRLRTLEKRIDILEEGHPDTDIDYGTVGDDGNITEVWFEGKKYVPEDKRAEETNTFYADNKVVAETTKSEAKCCATCQHYRPESGFSTCDLRTWLHATKKYATMADSACNNYEKASTPCVSSDKGKVEYICGIYEEIGRNGETEWLTKKIADLNYLYNGGLMSAATYMHRWEELMQNDT